MLIMDSKKDTTQPRERAAELNDKNTVAPSYDRPSFGDGLHQQPGTSEATALTRAPEMDLEHNAGNLPPMFSEYDAEQQRSWSDNTVSHDPHLNTDGEALYRFLLQQAEVPPRFMLKLRGTHQETHYHTVTTTTNGHTSTRQERRSETVTDFSFEIDLGLSLTPGYDIWSLPDNEPAYRGKMIREVVDSGVKRAVLKEERGAAAGWQSYRKKKGIAPWMASQGLFANTNVPEPDFQPLRSSHTLRELADEYCASERILKEFVFDKVVYGWDFEAVTTAIREAIQATGYSHQIHIDFNREGHKVYVRPSTRLSRTLSNPWLKVLLWILLIYPFIWLFKRYNSHGGGIWRVYGAAYSLKLRPLQLASGYGPAQVQAVQMNGDWDVNSMRASLGGLKEGEWFRIWDPTIRRAVVDKLRASTPFTVPYPPDRAGHALDGY